MDRVEEQTHMMLALGEIECRVSFPQNFHELQLDDVVKQNCFLIFKEALTNIVKHSNADKVDITMRCQDKGLLMSITDNGCAVSSGNSNGGGNGLKNMQRRADKMLSELTISSHDGFRIELRVPKAFAD